MVCQTKVRPTKQLQCRKLELSLNEKKTTQHNPMLSFFILFYKCWIYKSIILVRAANETKQRKRILALYVLTWYFNTVIKTFNAVSFTFRTVKCFISLMVDICWSVIAVISLPAFDQPTLKLYLTLEINYNSTLTTSGINKIYGCNSLTTYFYN